MQQAMLPMQPMFLRAGREASFAPPLPPMFSHTYGVPVAGPTAQGPARDVQLQLRAGVVVFDLECVHDNPRGSYLAQGLVETSNQWEWKQRCQIIEFAAIDIITGESFSVRCRPQFNWQDVTSHAARRFAEDHGHREIIEDMGLPHFEEIWHSELIPFLQRAAGATGNVVLLAHNGAAFDEFVLKKEIARLQLDMSCCPNLMYADPVAAVKDNYHHPAVAAEYRGRHMSLALADMHQRYVSHPNRTFQQHQALDDCHLLLDVLRHAPYVADALAAHICNMIGLHVPDLASMLRNRLQNPMNIRDPLPAPRIFEYCGKRYLLKNIPVIPAPPVLPAPTVFVPVPVPTPALAGSVVPPPPSTPPDETMMPPPPPPTPPPEETLTPPPPPPVLPAITSQSPSPPSSPPTFAPATPPMAPVGAVRTVLDVEDDLKKEDPKDKSKKKNRADWWDGNWDNHGHDWWAWSRYAYDSSYDGGAWGYQSYGKGGYQSCGKGRQRGGGAKGKRGKSKTAGGKAASPVAAAPTQPTGAESSTVTKAFKYQ